MADQIEKIHEILLRSGFRLTSSRQAIIETLVSCEGHITADDLAVEVRHRAPRVGRMTVYRTLDLLSELGTIRPIYQGTGAAHFILMDDGSHHHLICRRCLNIIEFEECLLGDLAQQLADQYDFHVTSHLLEFHGLCANCHSTAHASREK